MERSPSRNHPISPSPTSLGTSSPSSGGEFLLQLLQQGRFSTPGTRIKPHSYGDGDAICSLHPGSSTSSGADWGGSSSFSRTSSLEASISSSFFEEEHTRAHPLCRTSSVEVSFLDDEQARFQLQHDPAVAAMGPSHPVGEVSAIANNMGNITGDGRGILPFHDRYAHPQYHHHHHHHQHLCYQQVPPSPPFDFPFPRPLSEHVPPFPMDPLLPPVHNQFLRPYPYAHLPPTVDENRYLHVPPSFPHTGLLNANRFQETSSTLSYPALDQLKPISNDGATNGQSITSMRTMVPSYKSAMDMAPLSSSEQVLAPSKSQFYTRFGSIGVEISHQSSSEGKSTHAGFPDTSVLQQPSSLNEHTRSLPLPLTPKGVVAQSFTYVESSKGDRQNHSSNVEASSVVTTIVGAHACQRRVLESIGAEGYSSMYKDDTEQLERSASAMDRALPVDTPSSQNEYGVDANISIADCITNASDADSVHDNTSEVKARFSKPQKSLESTRKGGSRIGLGHWVPVTKDKREEATVDKMDPVAASEVLTRKAIDDVRRQRGSNQGWRSKQLSSTFDLPSVEPMDSPKRVDRSTRTKLPLQQNALGLPSGSKVDSAPSSETEQSKQALQIPADNDTVDSRIQEQTANYVHADLDLKGGANDGIAKNLVRHLSLSEFDRDRDEGEEPAGKDKGLNLGVKESDARVARPIKFNRRESFHRLDSGKCTSILLAIFQTLIPPTDEEQRRQQLLATLDELVSGIWPEARLYLFGSCANAFGVCNSDIDVCLSIEGESTPRSEVVCTLADALKANNMQNVQALTHARVPIVKYSDPKTGISCDVCVNNMLAVVNTKLLHDYAQIDVRLRQLAFIVKHWAKSRQVNETYRGTLSSYAYVLMCIHFLQQRKPPVLPCLQELEPTYRVTVGDIKCAYFDRVDKLKGFGQKNKETLADLVASFFDYWAFRHDYTRTVISIRTGKFLSKVEKDWTRRIGNERHLICIEDPFEVSHDLGRVVDKHSIRVLRDEFQRAARIMRQEANPCVALFEPYIRQKAQAA